MCKNWFVLKLVRAKNDRYQNWLMPKLTFLKIDMNQNWYLLKLMYQKWCGLTWLWGLRWDGSTFSPNVYKISNQFQNLRSDHKRANPVIALLIAQNLVESDLCACRVVGIVPNCQQVVCVLVYPIVQVRPATIAGRPLEFQNNGAAIYEPSFPLAGAGSF